MDPAPPLPHIEHFNGSPAYALLARAVANLDQPPPNRNSLPDPTYSTFQEDREDTASGQEVRRQLDEGRQYMYGFQSFHRAGFSCVCRYLYDSSMETVHHPTFCGL